MSSRTGKSKKNKSKSKSKGKSKGKTKLKSRRQNNGQSNTKPDRRPSPHSEELNEAKRKAKEEELLRKAEEEEKEKERIDAIRRENEEAHTSIINDYIAKFVDGALLRDIETMDDVDELEQNEKPKPRHQLSSFLEVLLDCEPNKKNLHEILTDQFLDNPLDFESKITHDKIDLNNEDYGDLDYSEWDLDDNEVKRLMNEWRRNVLDPVMATYQDKMLPWCPDIPIAQEIYDSFGDTDDDDNIDADIDIQQSIHDEQTDHDDEEKQDMPGYHVPVKVTKKKGKKGKAGKKEKKSSEDEIDEDVKEEIIEDIQDREDTPDIVTDEDNDMDEDDDIDEDDEDHGSLVSESMDEHDESDEESDDDDDDDDDDDADDDEPHIKTDTDDDDDDEDDEEEEEEEEDGNDEYGSGGSGDSGDTGDSDADNDSGDDINWKELTHEEALAKDKFYRFGKRLTSSSFPQYVLQNIPSRFMSVNEEYNEQTHMAPVPWKRIFYHYKDDKISLPNNAASKTVEAEYKKIDFEVIEWDKIQEEKYSDDEGDESIDLIDKILQEIPDNYNDILDCSMEVNLEDVYTLRKKALEKYKRDGRKQLGEMMQLYVNKFQCDPLPKNIISDTYKQPKFIANFSNMKKYNEYCLINVKFDKMITEADSDDSDEADSDDSEEIVKDTTVNEDIAWSPWWTYRIRIWAKFTDKDWKEVNENKDDEDSDTDISDSSDDDDDDEDKSDNDDDDDIVEKRAAKKEKKRLAKLRKKNNKINGRYFTSKLSSDDPIGYKLLCDHFVVQNDHCFGRPTRFYWDEAIHEDYGGGSMDHRFGDYLTEDINELGYTFPDLNHPLYIHPGQDIQNDLSGGIFCNGLSFIIGKDSPYDLISIDVRIPPVTQLYNMSTEEAWCDGWGKAAVSPYKVWREQGEFMKGVFTYGARMDPQVNDMEDAFPDNDGDIDEGFVLLCENLPFECNAFYLNNHYLRLFNMVDPEIDADNIQSDGYTLFTSDIFDNNEYNHGKDNDQWLITVGFTHPRPHSQPSVILYKNNSVEIRLKSEYDYVNDDKDKTGHMYKQEILEIYLIYMTRGGKRDKILSMPIRQHFNEDYIIHNSDMVVVGDECVESHILMLSKNKQGVIKVYLNGKKIIDNKIRGNNSTHLLQKTKNETNNNIPFQVLVGHKRTGDDNIGKCVDFFHGYIYDIAIFPYCPFEFEINLIYRSLKLDHDIHLRQHWDLQQEKYKQENANLNFRID